MHKVIMSRINYISKVYFLEHIQKQQLRSSWPNFNEIHTCDAPCPYYFQNKKNKRGFDHVGKLDKWCWVNNGGACLMKILHNSQQLSQPW